MAGSRGRRATIRERRRPEHPEREVFLELSARAVEPEALAAAQEILVRSGALSYCVFKLLEILGEARALLAGIPLPSPESLLRLFDAQTQPIHHLFAAAAVPDADSLRLHQP